MAMRSRDEIAEIRAKIILAGKAQVQYVKCAKGNWYKAPGHFDKGNIEMSGAIELDDAWYLYQFIYETVRIETIFEIGTWFGTSAAIMAMAMKDRDEGRSHKVYTCCIDPVYLGKALPYSDMIEYFNRDSSGIIRKLQSQKICCDFAFIDGKLFDGDAERLLTIMRPTCEIAIHDSSPKEKGGRNITALMRAAHNVNYFNMTRNVTKAMGLISITE